MALGVYVHDLDTRSLWWDEGSSAYIANLSWGELLRFNAADVHPPAYYLLLHGWMRLAGPSPFSLRLFSALAAVLAVPLAYACGRRLGGPRAGGLSALFIALSPYGHFYAREARMYSLGMLLVLASSYAFLRLMAPPPRAFRWWALYTAVAVTGLHTHYAFFFVIASQAAGVVVAWRQRLTRLGPWAAAWAAAGLAFAPWMIFTLPKVMSLVTFRFGGEAGPQADMGAMLLGLGRVALGQVVVGDLEETLALGMLAALVAAAAVGAGRVRLAVRAGLAFGLMSGLLMLAFLQRRIAGEDLALAARQAFQAAPLMWLLAAAGLSRLARARRWLAAVALGLLLPGLLRANMLNHTPAPNLAEDYQPLIAWLRLHAKPGDAALATYPWQEGYFVSYADDLDLEFFRNEYDAATAPGLLSGIARGHHRLWILNYRADIHNPDDPLNRWLAENAGLAYAEWYGTSQLALFGLGGPVPDEWPAERELERGVRLGFQPQSITAGPGDLILLDLRWLAAGPLDSDYRVFVHLRQPPGAPISQSDGVPGGGVRPAATWPPGQPILDRRAILVPADAAPGEYQLIAGLYEPASGRRLRLPAPSGCDLDDGVCLGFVTVRTPLGD